MRNRPSRIFVKDRLGGVFHDEPQVALFHRDVYKRQIEELLAAWHAGAAEDAGCPEKIVALTMPAVERVLAKTYPSFGDCYPEMVESAAREIWRNALSYDLDGDEPFSMRCV